MWRDYSAGYIRHNRASGVSIMTAAFVSALFLSLLSGLFYNLWKYEIERIELEEGGWQSRITGEFSREERERIGKFAHVEQVMVNEAESPDSGTAVDLYFDSMGNVLKGTAAIAGALGISPESVNYNQELLALYLVRDPADSSPRLIFPFFLLVMTLAVLALVIIIHNSFAVSGNARIRQFGILSSTGATPRQIRSCLLQEAAVLCAGPVAAGDILGICLCAVVVRLSNVFMADASGRHIAVFGYHPLVFAFTLAVTALTVGISALIPAWKLSRLTPLEAVRNQEGQTVRRKRNSRLLAFFFGPEGELAGNALKAQRKAQRTASLSLILAFLAFTLMQCFFTLSDISTGETYFARYQDAWDIMITVKDTRIEDFAGTEGLRQLPGVRNAAVYQKAAAGRLIKEEELSAELLVLGGFAHAPAGSAVRTEDGWLVSAPLVILDDASFCDYCEQIGAAPRTDGAIILNRIQDMTDPDFRHRKSLPYVKGENPGSAVRSVEAPEKEAQLPIIAYADEPPVLREEYGTLDLCELVHFLPLSLWQSAEKEIGGSEEDVYVRILGLEGSGEKELQKLQEQADRLLGETCVTESENRLQEKEQNDRMILGMKTILAGFCVLLAMIGVGSVFSSALGFVRQRRREFARYMSVGMTPAQLRKMFCVEALVTVGRPVLITLPTAALATWYMLRISYLEPAEFLARAPLAPIAAFMLAIVLFVSLAYFLGWRAVRQLELAGILRDDTLT